MPTPELADDVIARLKMSVWTLRVILFALVIGVVTFMGVVFFVIGPQQPAANLPNANAPAANPAGVNAPAGAEVMNQLLTFGGFLAAVGAVIASRLLPIILTSVARKQIAAGTYPPPTTGPATPPSTLADLGDISRLMQTYMTNSIVSAALLEGAAFFNTVAFMIEGNQVSIVTAGVLTLLILALMPSTARVVNWIERQLRLIEEDKLLAR